MTRRVRKLLPGVVLVPDIAATPAALTAWRTQRHAAAPLPPPLPPR
jgi:hypothetical protein